MPGTLSILNAKVVNPDVRTRANRWRKRRASKTKIGNHETEQRARVSGNARPPKIGETQKAYTENQ